MKISSKTIAREWLIFLASYLTCFLIITAIILCRNIPYDSDAFVTPLFFYGFICFVRSVIWSIKTVRQPKEKLGNPSPAIPAEQKLKTSEATVSTTKNNSKTLEWFRKHTEVSPKTIFWFSIFLLSVCIVFWIYGFASVNWSSLSVEEQGKVAYKMVSGLFKVVFAVVVVTWSIKGKTEKLFTASVVFAIATAIAFYYYWV